jgi:hypothetical protein
MSMYFRHLAKQAMADAAKITGVERSWLQLHLDADGQLDELEKTLLDFLPRNRGG